MIEYFATAAAGTEGLVARELEGVGAKGIRTHKGGVRFKGTLETALAACLWSRVAMRILQPLAKFPALDGDELYEGVRDIDWPAYLSTRMTFAVDATGMTEALRHTHFTALRVKDAIVDVMREKTGSRPSIDARDPDLQVVVHLGRGQCELSLDLTGQPLFKRGYRQVPGRASLKETLAAAVLLTAGYDGTQALVDPMCGAGTIAIEAALIAANRAPGLGRSFGVERWASFGQAERAVLTRLREEARAGERKVIPRIVACDRDPEMVEATRANVHRAKVQVEVREGDARELEGLAPPAWLVVNPPYGERLDGGGRKQLKTFFWQLGQRWRTLSGHEIAVLAGGPEFESAFGLRPLSRTPFFNGPIECQLLRYRIP